MVNVAQQQSLLGISSSSTFAFEGATTTTIARGGVIGEGASPKRAREETEEEEYDIEKDQGKRMAGMEMEGETPFVMKKVDGKFM
jgi:hypothetical protein